ncbi:MAG: RNA-binding domain-containing protein [Thermoplasmata archaeon]
MAIFILSIYDYVPIKMHVIAKVALYPTENPEKIKNAMLSLFPDMHISIRGSFIEGESKSVETLKNAIKKQKIRDTARAVLIKCKSDTGLETKFNISKQAATVGKVNFAEHESPLGDIELTIRVNDGEKLDEIIDFIAPSTVKEIKPHDEIDAINDTKHYIRDNLGWETALATGKPKKGMTKPNFKAKRHISKHLTKEEIKDELPSLDKDFDEPDIGEEYSDEE